MPRLGDCQGTDVFNGATKYNPNNKVWSRQLPGGLRRTWHRLTPRATLAQRCAKFRRSLGSRIWKQSLGPLLHCRPQREATLKPGSPRASAPLSSLLHSVFRSGIHTTTKYTRFHTFIADGTPPRRGVRIKTDAQVCETP